VYVVARAPPADGEGDATTREPGLFVSAAAGATGPKGDTGATGAAGAAGATGEAEGHRPDLRDEVHAQLHGKGRVKVRLKFAKRLKRAPKVVVRVTSGTKAKSRTVTAR
jgi:hypothetical protein